MHAWHQRNKVKESKRNRPFLNDWITTWSFCMQSKAIPGDAFLVLTSNHYSCMTFGCHWLPLFVCLIYSRKWINCFLFSVCFCCHDRETLSSIPWVIEVKKQRKVVTFIQLPLIISHLVERSLHNKSILNFVIFC